MGEFTMPSLGADMDEGTLLEWRVAVGDHVDRGDIVAVVDTEKSTIEVEVFESGVIDELLVAPGTRVAVGTPLARIGGGHPRSAAPAPRQAPAEPRRTVAPTRDVAPPEVVPPRTVQPGPARGAMLSPVLRHLAARLGVDTDHLRGSGVGGRITRADVEAAARTAPESSPESTHAETGGGSSPWARRQAAERGVDLSTVVGSGPLGAVRVRDLDTVASRPTQPSAATVVPQPSAASAESPAGPADKKATMRRAIARLMTTANREIPHYHLSTTIDLHDALSWLEGRNAGRPNAERVLPAALLLRAAALAAAAHPELNGFWIDDAFSPADGVHLGVAVSLRGGGLVAPAILDADRRSLEETMESLRDLVERARRSSLRSSEMNSATITVTNLGDRGAEAVFGVIHPPQIALVGFGCIVDRPVAVDGLVGVHPTVTATLSGDHRATDGHVGSRMLETIDDLLHHPSEL